MSSKQEGGTPTPEVGAMTLVIMDRVAVETLLAEASASLGSYVELNGHLALAIKVATGATT